jgi:hypothetical protein
MKELTEIERQIITAQKLLSEKEAGPLKGFESKAKKSSQQSSNSSR